jgi:putative endonuclease
VRPRSTVVGPGWGDLIDSWASCYREFVVTSTCKRIDSSESPSGLSAHADALAIDSPWVLYLLECRGGSLYAGISNDLAKRLKAHEQGTGARYTRANPPVRVVGVRGFSNRSTASQAEWRIKQLTRPQKLSFIATLARE